ncbi:hypothetical protein NBRC116595_03260 [Aliiglaciecola sp. NS0011-25]
MYAKSTNLNFEMAYNEVAKALYNAKINGLHKLEVCHSSGTFSMSIFAKENRGAKLYYGYRSGNYQFKGDFIFIGWQTLLYCATGV